jgi:pilus assembly protein CpaF
MSEQTASSTDVHDIKTRVHSLLLERLDFSVMAVGEPEAIRSQLSILIMQILEELGAALTVAELQQVVREIQHDVLGLGPLEVLLEDPTVSDILVNSYRQIYVERGGKLERTEQRFRDDTHLREVIEKIVSAVGRRIDESSPMVDARLPDGSRVNAIVPPLAIDGPILSIRKFNKNMLTLEDMVRMHALTTGIGELLTGIVQARLSVVISGGTGSGKTTMLNLLSGFIPSTERIVTIEDSAELQLRQDHVVRLETRMANIEGKGEVTQRALVRNSLRMRPDRIILGEVRSDEALDMLQAMNTGHDGSLATVHANTPQDAVARIETMVAMGGLDIPPHAVRQQIASAMQVVIQVQRLSDGSRKLISLQEMHGLKDGEIELREIFRFEQVGLDDQGRVRGRFRATGLVPAFLDRLKVHGCTVGQDLFDPRHVEEC